MAQPASYCPIFLQWPCLPTSEWAAWAQVSVAVAIGFAAIYVPWQMSRNQARRRISSILTLCSITIFQFLQAADAAIERTSDPLQYKYFRDAGNDMLNAIRQIPTHELLEWEVMQVRIYLELRCVEFITHADRWHHSSAGFSALHETPHEEVLRHQDLLRISLREVAQLMRRHQSLPTKVARKLRDRTEIT
ncbi:hypothetical protein [Stenotrophomonas bentonitica]